MNTLDEIALRALAVAVAAPSVEAWVRGARSCRVSFKWVHRRITLHHSTAGTDYAYRIDAESPAHLLERYAAEGLWPFELDGEHATGWRCSAGRYLAADQRCYTPRGGTCRRCGGRGWTTRPVAWAEVVAFGMLGAERLRELVALTTLRETHSSTRPLVLWGAYAPLDGSLKRAQRALEKAFFRGDARGARYWALEVFPMEPVGGVSVLGTAWTENALPWTSDAT